MVCPHCGVPLQRTAGRCPACGSTFTVASVASDVTPIDTTGLPAGATFGAAGPPNTAGDAFAVTTFDARIAAVATALSIPLVERPRVLGPLRDGQALGARYRILKLLGIGGMG